VLPVARWGSQLVVLEPLALVAQLVGDAAVAQVVLRHQQ
jgi:hypothetical protein